MREMLTNSSWKISKEETPQVMQKSWNDNNKINLKRSRICRYGLNWIGLQQDSMADPDHLCNNQLLKKDLVP
jgi:hypothetical protein